MSKEREILGAAFHEAGHAAAYLWYKRDVAFVEMKVDASGTAHATKGVSPYLDLAPAVHQGSKEARRLIEMEMVIAYAGIVAESRVIGFEVMPDYVQLTEESGDYDVRFSSDRENIMMLQSIWRRAHTLRERMLRRAKWLSAKREVWAAVTAIAERLLVLSRERPAGPWRISGEEARALYDAAVGEARDY